MRMILLLKPCLLGGGGGGGTHILTRFKKRMNRQLCRLLDNFKQKTCYNIK